MREMEFHWQDDDPVVATFAIHLWDRRAKNTLSGTSSELGMLKKPVGLAATTKHHISGQD